MADALVSIVLEQLETVIRREIDQEIKLVVGVRNDIRKLTTKLTLIQAVLEDAEQKQVKDKAVMHWVDRLKDIVYDADDVLEEWNTRNIISLIKGVDTGFTNKVLSCFCFRIQRIRVRHNIGHMIKVIRESLDLIAHEKDQFNFNISVSQVQQETRYITSSIVDVSKICGRDTDKDVVMSKLLCESSRQEMHVIPVVAITGMGGFGKTTFAKLVFKEDEVVATFEKRMWVCVSEPFDLVCIAEQIIEQAEGKIRGGRGWEVLHQSLCDSLEGKRFLLVLDDVWTSDSKLWSPLKASLDCGAPGSRVLVTTRDEAVARMMGSTHIHRLGQLAEEDGWEMFRSIAFLGRENELSKFEEIGKGIVEKCKGVPLAIKTLASLMRHKRTKQEWRSVLVSDIWELSAFEKDFLPSLFMSYYDLPSPLRRCFLYCVIFPKDTDMVKDDLVKLWMAQGYLGSDGRRDLETIGVEYFDNLAGRSFFQDFERNTDGDITSCKIHDLVHDFVQFLTKRECCILGEETDLDISGFRHLFGGQVKHSLIFKAKKARSYLRCNRAIGSSLDLLIQLTCLRALDLSHDMFEELPSEVGRLLHLRYLNLSSTNLLELPETVCDLHNLQTLKLNRCEELHKLPDDIGNLSNLRHLEIEATRALRYLPQCIGRLRFLRTLSKFVVGEGCSIRELKHLNLLKGRLELSGLERVADVSEVSQAELKNKNLDALILKFEHLEGHYAEKMTDIMERLQLNAHLEQLHIWGYPGFRLPNWLTCTSILSSLCNLKLQGCNCTDLYALGKLASLEKLEVREMNLVKHISSEFYGIEDANNSSSVNHQDVAFPKLKILEFDNMKEWKEWKLPVSLATKIMPCLSKLKLNACPKLRALPGLGKLQSLENIQIGSLSSLKSVGFEFLGICSDGCGEEVSRGAILFPCLTNLEFHFMNEWEDWSFPLAHHQDAGVIIMPCLRDLKVLDCPKLRVVPDLSKFISLETIRLGSIQCNRGPDGKLSFDGGEGTRDVRLPCLRQLSIGCHGRLKAIPQYMFSDSLRELNIYGCPNLRGMQPCIPPFLERLTLWHDAGVYSKSLSLDENNNYLNLRSVSIAFSSQLSLPKGLNKLKAIQELEFHNCDFLAFELKELKDLTVLQDLKINRCPTLKRLFHGDEWRTILSHVPKIMIDYEEIRNNSGLTSLPVHSNPNK